MQLQLLKLSYQKAWNQRLFYYFLFILCRYRDTQAFLNMQKLIAMIRQYSMLIEAWTYAYILWNDIYISSHPFKLWNTHDELWNIFNYAGEISCCITLQALVLCEWSKNHINASPKHGTAHKDIGFFIQSLWSKSNFKLCAWEWSWVLFIIRASSSWFSQQTNG